MEANEYDDEIIEQHLSIMREKFPNIEGLQSTCVGQYVQGTSIPKFRAVLQEKFVQILHNYDHWICITNVFSDDPLNIYVYDSLYTSLEMSTIVQASSLLRIMAKDIKQLSFEIRQFRQQRTGTRLCGLYAVAAALAACQGVDVSCHLYDENVLMS